MAHHKSCIKRAKTSEIARMRNRAYRSQMRTAVKKVLTSADPEAAAAEYRKASSILDRLARKGVIHRNNAANQKSRLAKVVNKLQAAQSE